MIEVGDVDRPFAAPADRAQEAARGELLRRPAQDGKEKPDYVARSERTLEVFAQSAEPEIGDASSGYSPFTPVTPPQTMNWLPV